MVITAQIDVDLDVEQIESVIVEHLTKDYLSLCRHATEAHQSDAEAWQKYADALLGALAYYMVPSEHVRLRETGLKISGQ